MSTTASLYHNNQNQVFTADGYPKNVIPAIMEMKKAVSNNQPFNSTVYNNEPMDFNNRPDDTLNYIYKINSDFTELSVLGYDKEAQTPIIDLEVFYDMYSRDPEAFQNALSDIGDFMDITPEDLEMSTDEWMDKYNGNAFDYAFHSMAVCLVKRFETPYETV